MIRIRIDNSLKDFANEFCKTLFEERSKKFVKPIKQLNDLLLNPVLNSKEKAIIRLCIKYYPELLLITPDQQQRIVSLIASKPSLVSIFYIDNKSTSFTEMLLKAFRYNDLREKEAYKIVERLGTKTCVYCNAQLAVVIEKGSSSKANLEFDHFFAKSKYPFLSTSFFNLIPSCSNCNKAKTDGDFEISTHFHLYTEEDQIDPFIFSLTPKSILNFLMNRDAQKLEIEFKDKSVESKSKEHDKAFSIVPIYNTQKDVAEELLLKKEVYPPSYKDELSKIKGLFPDKQLIDRMILGNYCETHNTHKRPLAKFTQDIARQIKLLKD